MGTVLKDNSIAIGSSFASVSIADLKARDYFHCEKCFCIGAYDIRYTVVRILY